MINEKQNFKLCIIKRADPLQQDRFKHGALLRPLLDSISTKHTDLMAGSFPFR